VKHERTCLAIRLSRAITAGLALGAVLAGCASAPPPPTYAQADLRAACDRQGGWWRPNVVSTGGLCEVQAPGGRH